MYVLKFRAAGHGARALVAELVAGEIARALGLPVPEIVLAELDRGPRAHRAGSGDPRAHPRQRRAESGARLPARLGDLRSGGAHAGAGPRVAHRVVRCLRQQRRSHARNTNMLMWHRAPWLIDHGARCTSIIARVGRRCRRAREPVRGDQGSRAAAARAARSGRGRRQLARAADAGGDRRRSSTLVPDEWLEDARAGAADEMRDAYRRYLLERLERAAPFVEEAARAR